MHIVVYGAGAVGCFLGIHLKEAGHDVTLVGRDWLKNLVNADQLIFQDASGRRRKVAGLHAVTKLDTLFLTESKDIDLLIFSMKAYDTVSSIFELQRCLAPPEGSSWDTPATPPPPIVCFQNGVGNEDSLVSAFGADLVGASTLTAAVSFEDGVIIEEKSRGIAISDDTGAGRLAITAFQESALVVESIDNSQSLKWSKLITNIMGNASCAILDMRPEEVYGSPELFAIEKAAVSEALQIMELSGIDLVDLPGLPVKLLARAIKTLPNVILRPLLKSRVTGGRGEKPPSLLLGLHQNKKKSEVEWLNGAVVKYADSIDRYVPVNHTLALVLYDITVDRVPWDMFRQSPEMLVTAVRASKNLALE